MNAAIIIPVYNHEQRVQRVVEQCVQLQLPIFVVDDGSTDNTAAILKKIPGITILRHTVNQGKGAALLTGFAAAAPTCEWAITLDADGQHCPADAEKLLNAVPDHQRPLIIGARQGMDNTHVPWTSRFGRKFSNFWIACSGGPRLKDSQSGFRIYPLPEALELNIKARRFQFEIEILVKACWEQISVIEVPVGVCYAPAGERISHFRPFVDFLRNTHTFSRLITRRILVHPFVGKHEGRI